VDRYTDAMPTQLYQVERRSAEGNVFGIVATHQVCIVQDIVASGHEGERAATGVGVRIEQIDARVLAQPNCRCVCVAVLYVWLAELGGI
tara:strand:- start:810 stop:1076 length:267 start_codon:yes stop_codon:yes gene_type:complete